LLIITNDVHHLIFTHTWLDTQSGGNALRVQFSPWYIASYVGGYVLIAIGTALLLRKWTHEKGVFRWQGAMILLGMAITVLANLFDLSGVGPFPQIKLTPLGLVVAVPLFIVTLTRARRADILPVARSNVIQVMQDGVIVLDVENRVVDLNPRAELLLGKALADVSGRPIAEVWPIWVAQVRPWLQQGAASSASNGAETMPLGHEVEIMIDDQRRVLDIMASPIVDWRGRLTSRVLVLRDITERVRAEEALRLSEERYRLHFAFVNDVIYGYDRQLRIYTVSPSIERHLGVAPDALIGKTLFEVDLLQPEYVEKAGREANAVLAGERIEGAVYEFKARDGSRKIAEISSSPIYKDGKVIGVVNLARDITERIQTEKRVKASLQEKEVLLKEIHHRVKNNLQIITSLLNLQSTKLQDPYLLAQFQDSANRIRSMALVHERMYRSDDLAHIDFGAYLGELSRALVRAYERFDQHIAIQVDADQVALDIDTAIPCGLLVNELVSNALKHAFPDGREGLISVEMRCVADHEVRLIVRDNGVGLPPGLNYRNTESLGLQLINSLAHQLNGSVELLDGPGTAFAVKLATPLAIAVPVAESAAR
jgi:PAS domain S-box-containing protein